MEPVNNLPLGNGELFRGNLCSTNAVEEVPAELFEERLGVKVPGERRHLLMRLAPDELYGVQTALDDTVLLPVVEEPVVLVRDGVPEGGKEPPGALKNAPAPLRERYSRGRSLICPKSSMSTGFPSTRANFRRQQDTDN